MANNTTVFGGMELLADALQPNLGTTIPKDDDKAIVVDPEDLVGGNDDDQVDEPDEKDDEVIPASKPEVKIDEEDDVPDEDTSELSEFEPDVAAFFQEKLASELGWEFADDEKFQSVGEVVDYMGKLVEEASKPKYANDEVAAYDEFVRNGGNLRDFYGRTMEGTIDIKNVDIEDETHQKRVIRDYLKEQGVKENIIDKRITRYEETGVLQDEAEESLNLLTEIVEKKQLKLLEDQRKEKESRDKQQREFFKTVEEYVNKAKDVRGIPITEAEKKETLEYIFKPTADGISQYQKDYMSHVKNLFESAFFTKKGDVLFNRAKKQAASDTALDLKKKISAKKDSRLSGRNDTDSGKISLGFGNLSNMLLKKV